MKEQIDLITAPTTASRGLPLLDERMRGTTFHEVPVKAILNSPATTGMGFWSINPYIGCEFGCTYCYARETHKWAVERAGGMPSGAADARGSSLPPDTYNLKSPLSPALAFERQILVKTTAASVLQRTLFPAKLAGSSLVIGTATDPYQPAERKFELTRSILDALRGWRGLSIGIITKSPLITRDIDLLQQLAERHELSINISIATVDPVMARRLEPRSPMPHTRIRAVKALVDAGIHAGLLVAPILPGLTDSRASLGALMAAGKAAGARYVVGSALRLGPAARSRFLPHLAGEFPELVERYRRRYGPVEGPGKHEGAGRDYEEGLARRLRALQREHGFPVGESMRRHRQLEGRQSRVAPAMIPEDQGVLL